jgi:hypothetical protein
MPETSVQPPKKISEPVAVTYMPPRRTWRQRLFEDFRSWSRHTFSRDSYITSLKSLLWVVPLTVLIWIWAEREQEVTNTVAVYVQAPGNKVDRVVRLVPDASVKEITAHIEGPPSVVDQVREWLATTTLSLDVPDVFEAGQHEIPLLPQLINHPMIKGKVTVKDCQDVSVSIEDIKEVEVDVVAEPSPETGELQPPVFEPAKVKIRAPKSDVEKAKKDGKLVAYASFKQFSAQLKQPGTQDLTLVPLSAPSSMNPATVRFNPPAVSARVRVPDKVQKTVLVHNAVIFAGYPSVDNATKVLARYRNLIDVQVTGPKAAVTAFENGSPLIAFFQVDVSKPDDRSPRQAELTFRLPEGVRVTEPDPQHQTITYNLEPRPSGRASDGG